MTLVAGPAPHATTSLRHDPATSGPLDVLTDLSPVSPIDTYVPDEVLRALALLAVPESRVTGEDGTPTTDDALDTTRAFRVVPREVTDARWQVLSADLAGRSTRDLPPDWAAEELQLIETVERVKAWLDLVATGATRRLRDAIGLATEAQWDHSRFIESGPLWDVTPEADTTTVDEIALVTGWSEHETGRRMRFACADDGRTRLLLTRLAEGRTTLDRCLRIFDASRACAADDVTIITDRVLAELPDGSVPSHRLFTRRLRRQVLLHLPDPDQRREDALSRRTAFGELLDDGSGILTVTGEGTRVVAALDRIDTIARGLRGSGDQRNLAALRSDVALDLLLVGWPVAPGPPHDAEVASGPSPEAGGRPRTPGAPKGGAGGSRAAGTPNGTGTSQGAGGSRAAGAGSGTGTPRAPRTTSGTGEPPASAANPTSSTSPPLDDEPDPRDLVDLTPWSTVGAAPPATVHVVVSLSTLLGLDDATAEVPGHGFLSADHVRQVAMNAGSVWRRLVTDPVTGVAIDLSTHRYRPTRRMADVVNALDGICRAPGCTVPAARCDLDHEIPWPRGETAVRNLSSRHRRHHNHKTRGLWRSTTDEHGHTTWRTVAGRTYLTSRFRYLDPANQPASDAVREWAEGLDEPPF